MQGDFHSHARDSKIRYTDAYLTARQIAEKLVKDLKNKTMVPDVGGGLLEMKELEEICGMSEDTKLQGKFMFAVPE
jgi:hypothetical protein